MVSESNDETNFPHKSLLTNTKVSRICKANGSSANTILSKTQLSKMVQLEGFNAFSFMLNQNKARADGIIYHSL